MASRNGKKNRNAPNNVTDAVVLSTKEKEIIDRVRTAYKVGRDSTTYEVLVFCDPVRQQIRNQQFKIETLLLSAANHRISANEAFAQLSGAEVTLKNEQGNPASEEQIKLHRDNKLLAARMDLAQIAFSLADITAQIEVCDLGSTVVMTGQQFEDYAKNILSRVKALGIDMAAEVRKNEAPKA